MAAEPAGAETAALAPALQQRLDREQDTLAQLRAALLQVLATVPGTGRVADVIRAPLINLSLQRDSFDGNETLSGEWHQAQDRHATRKCGQVQIHSGGQIFAECDVIMAHPTDRRWFIEAVSAWGARDAIKCELRLLPALGE
jgi:hypothetical protein